MSDGPASAPCHITAVHLRQVLSYARERKHFMPLWFSNVSTVIMFWTYIKALWRATFGKYFGGGIKFKTTLKVSRHCCCTLLAFTACTAAHSPSGSHPL